MNQSAPPSRAYYLPQLDGLRFCAFLLIFIHHLPGFDNPVLSQFKRIGWLGVDIFFTLSAFLLTHLLLIEWKQNNKINVRHFMIRRILRIWPLYFGYVVIALLIGVSFFEWTDNHGERLFGLLTFTDNIFAAVNGFNPIHFTGHLWTICFEEQFYLLLPLLIVFIILPFWSSRNMIICSLMLLSIIISYFFIDQEIKHPAIWVLPVTRFLPLGVGMLIALNSSLLQKVKTQWWVLFAALCIMTIFLLPSTDLISPHLLILYPATAVFCGSVLMITLHSRVTSTLLSYQWISFAGKISYGFYVFHSIAIVFVFQVFRGYNVYVCSIAALILTGVTAFISYYFYERRFLMMKKRFSPVVSGNY